MYTITLPNAYDKRYDSVISSENKVLKPIISDTVDFKFDNEFTGIIDA